MGIHSFPLKAEEPYKPMMKKLLHALLLAGLLASWWISPGRANDDAPPLAPPALEPRPYSPGLPLYLPLLKQTGKTSAPLPVSASPRIHAPYFPQDILLNQAAIFWFGRVSQTENYADVRLGYTSTHLIVRLSATDQKLWYRANPPAGEIINWDAVSLYLQPAGSTAYRFDGQLDWFEGKKFSRLPYQAAYRQSGGSWNPYNASFSTETGWRGNAPNDDQPDHGWWILYEIPFTSLGLNDAPQGDTIWHMALTLHDRDDADAAPLPASHWPEGMQPESLSTWGEVDFALPVFTPLPHSASGGVLTLRHGLNGVTVKDGAVGGSFNCGEGLDRWTEWGDANLAGAPDINVQNERDISDFPCFSKFYITFPLDRLPPGKVILSAGLTLHQLGNAGGGEWGDPGDSLVQVMAVAGDWEEATLTWNNAPAAMENVGQAPVDPITDWPGQPGVPRLWDLSYAVQRAYASGEPLRLVLYSADTAYNTGRYFHSSDAPDWNAEGRPTLQITWGEP